MNEMSFGAIIFPDNEEVVLNNLRNFFDWIKVQIIYLLKWTALVDETVHAPFYILERKDVDDF